MNARKVAACHLRRLDLPPDLQAVPVPPDLREPGTPQAKHLEQESGEGREQQEQQPFQVPPGFPSRQSRANRSRLYRGMQQQGLQQESFRASAQRLPKQPHLDGAHEELQEQTRHP